VSTASQPESSGTTRNIIIAAVVVVLLLVGYCATRVAGVARSVVDQAKGIQARMDTTHHVAAGSAVFLGDTKVADIVKVIVIRADTSTPAKPTHGALDSTVQLALRQQTVVYTAAAPAPSDASQLSDVLLIGKVDGTFDTDTPVKITLSRRTGAGTMIPSVQLIIPGRRQPISVY